MKTLYVRIPPSQRTVEKFFRCGIQFGREWKKVDVVDATACRLAAEQMLEVSETVPAELESKAPNEADPSGVSTAVTNSGTPAAAPGTLAAASDDLAERRDAILVAIGQLDKDNPTLWTTGGKPKTEAISAITGWPMTAAERDAAMAEGKV